jgi:hypothetical protein
MLIPIEYLTGNIDISKSPLEYLLDKEECLDIDKMLLQLTPREERVIRYRFGLFGDGNFLTLEQAGIKMNVGKQRLREIEAKALRKLKHPKKSSVLRMCLLRHSHSVTNHQLPARHYMPAWKIAIKHYVHKYFHRMYSDFDFRRFYQGKMTTMELIEYFESKEGLDK